MNVYHLSHFHISHSGIKTFNHHAGTTYELQRFSPVIGRIKLCAVIEGSAVMGSAGLSHVFTDYA